MNPMSPRKSALIIGNHLSATGNTYAVCEELSHHLRDRGWDIFTTSHYAARFPRLADMLWATWSQRKNYAVAQVDVFSGTAFMWAEAVTRLLYALKKPYVLTLHGGNLPSFAARHPQHIRAVLSSATAVTCPSHYLQEKLLPYCPDIQLLPNALHIKNYPYRLREQPKPNLVWLRSFHNIYNPSLAIRVVSRLKKYYPETQLWMVGPDKGDRSLQTAQKLARELGVYESIEWVGAVPKTDVPLWLNKGDIFINTTNIDNTPVSVIEAMACGLCVISTDVGGIPYLLKDQKDALLIPPNDPDAMSQAILGLAQGSSLAPSLSANARASAEKYDWDNILGIWDKLLLETAERKRQ
jgi:glycosyltransferase involved in cell wall biosynthesis